MASARLPASNAAPREISDGVQILSAIPLLFCRITLALRLCRTKMTLSGGGNCVAAQPWRGGDFIRQRFATAPADGIAAVIGDVCAVTQGRDVEFDITGLLTVKGSRFARVIEGQQRALRTLRASIKRDLRHHSVTVIAGWPSETRGVWVADGLSRSQGVRAQSARHCAAADGVNGAHGQRLDPLR